MPSQKRRAPSRQKKATTRAGKYVKQEMRAMKAGSKHVKSRKQAIAVGLSEARRHGLHVPPNPHR
jgi:hypothetical protein